MLNTPKQHQGATVANLPWGVEEQLLETRPVPSFEAVYHEYFPFVWRTARRMGVMESALDDVCQDVFVAVHRRLPEFEGRSSLRTWMFGFVMNVVSIHHRTQRRKSVSHRAAGEVVDPDTLEDHWNHTPDEQLSLSQAARIAHDLLSRLPADHRAVFILSEFEGLSASEIADTEHANANTVYTRLRAARHQFSQGVKRHRARDRWRLDN